MDELRWEYLILKIASEEIKRQIDIQIHSEEPSKMPCRSIEWKYK
ncbi:MAG: hypothetical protein N2V74_06470 [Candidatus Methanospirare jalkutatii]|nr:MAG: hypothetical protein N2V74_06470 [Candidatus Methanospirare jalkutatii]